VGRRCTNDKDKMMQRFGMLLAGAVAGALMAIASPAPAEQATDNPRERARPGDDTSGQAHRGEASYYHPRFEGREMANGERFDADSNSAASRRLPLGTTARVTNLENGRSAEVEIEDRGPYARGRVLDVSPRTAEELDMKQDGTARVEIAPIEVPQRDGSRRPGAGAAEASRTGAGAPGAGPTGGGGGGGAR
jgi:rare lipoprotein A